jgi:hypothetical protein
MDYEQLMLKIQISLRMLEPTNANNSNFMGHSMLVIATNAYSSNFFGQVGYSQQML